MTLATLLSAALLSAAPAASPSPLFPAIEGWQLVDAPTSYTPENLFDYINGAADAFLQNDFQELETATYGNAEKVQVTVDVYRHRDATRAYGMYAQERSEKATPLPIGVEGVAAADHLEFVKGDRYVKLAQAGGRGKELLRPIADKLAAALPGTAKPPAVLGAFPKKGQRARSEKFAARDFLGHAFLKDGVAMSYELAGAKFRLFAIEAKDPADARAMLEKYAALAKAKAPDGAAGATSLQDPLNGTVELRWAGRWLWGCVDAAPEGSGELLRELGQKLAAP